MLDGSSPLFPQWLSTFTKGKTMIGDILGFILTILGAAKYWDEIRALKTKLFKLGFKSWHLFAIWYQHNVAVRVRWLLLCAITINMIILTMALWWIKIWCHLPQPLVSNILWYTQMPFMTGIAVPVLWEMYCLGKVKPIEWDAFCNELDGLSKEEIEKRWGRTGRLHTVRAFLYFVCSYFLTALWLFGVGGWLYTNDSSFFAHHVAYPYVIPVLLLATIAGLVGIIAWVFTAMLLGGTIQEGGDIFNRLLHLMIRPLAIALPGITAENVDTQVRPFNLPFNSFGDTIKHLHVAPLAGTLMLYASFLIYPDLWVIIVGVLPLFIVTSAVDYARSKRGQMDTLPWIQKSLTLSGVLLTLGAIWRLYEMWHWRETGGDWISFDDVLNGGIGWMNLLMATPWYLGIVIVAVAGYIFKLVSEIKDPGPVAKVMKFVFGAVMLLVVLGWIGGLAGRRPSITAMGDPNTPAGTTPTVDSPTDTTPVPQGNMVSQIRQWAATAPPAVAVPQPVYQQPQPPVAATVRHHHHHARGTQVPANETPSNNSEGFTNDFATQARSYGVEIH